MVYKDFVSSVIVWKYFLKAEDSQTAKCKLCKSIIKTTGRSTKGLHVHLKSKHKIDSSKKNDSLAPEEALRSDPDIATSSSASASDSSAPPPTPQSQQPTQDENLQDTSNSSASSTKKKKNYRSFP